ncbi:MAG: type II CAAX endopeptidase family protein [Halanaerobacter sp.]
MKRKIELLIIIIGVNLLWYFIFNTTIFNFWFRLAVAIITLNLVAISYQDYNLTLNDADIMWGLLSALLLYFIFMIGRELSGVLFSRSQEQIMSVYSLKEEDSLITISLILFLAGLGEELFWRGFLQQNLSHIYNDGWGYIITSLIYGGVHLWTGNLILFFAALTAGLFWGYLFLKYNSLSLVIISHIVWDLLIFIVFPLNF